MRGPLAIFALVGIGIFVWYQMGGGIQADKPQVDRPEIEAPDINEVTRSTGNAANTLADEVSSWQPQTWQWIIIALLATGFVIMWTRSPRFKYIIIGLGLAAIIAVGVVPQLSR